MSNEVPHQLCNTELRFLNPEINEPITDFWIVYHIAVMQYNHDIDVYTNQHIEDGKASFVVSQKMRTKNKPDRILFVNA